MQTFPHHYKVEAAATADTDVQLDCAQLPRIIAAPPAEFDGPGDKWSPETLLVSAVAGCFILTFKAIAGASRFTWTAIDCEVEAIVDTVDKVPQVTHVNFKASLKIPADQREDRALRLLQKAEQSCLVTSSLKATKQLDANIETV